MRLRSVLLVAACFTAACTWGAERSAGPTSSAPEGGTLRVGMRLDVEQNLDPTKEYLGARGYPLASWELFRCCLLRTLLSYRGLPVDRGGTELLPDLAERLPDISADGLTWTFHLKRGIRYAPPLDELGVTAPDVIRALLREADPVGSGAFVYSFYYSVIQGFDDVIAGRADAIAGLVASGPYTLQVRLARPTGDLGYRLSLPAAAPIPPDPFHPDAALGVAQGHGGDYGHYLVGTGPYMLEGSEDLDFSLEGLLQPGVAGYQASRSITLVRNPSWRRSTDPLRPAHVDRIEIRVARTPVAGDVEDLMPLVESGELDLMLNASPAGDRVGAYRSDPELAARLHRDLSNQIAFLSMNVALPPFDDVHVRRAVNLVLDKARLVDLANEHGFFGRAATHVATDSLEGGLLEGFEGYAFDPDAARVEMRRSRYDADSDGRCDASVCRDVRFEELTPVFPLLTGTLWTDSVRRALERIGIHLATTTNPYIADAPQERIALEFGAGAAWQSDYPQASTFFEEVFSGQSIRKAYAAETFNFNFSLVGARPSDLRSWGYARLRVPTIDDRIAACAATTGSPGARCWASLDAYLMTSIVPIVPILAGETVRLVSSRVRGYAVDQFTGLPALDRIWLTSGSS
jgi:ABC-type transport system substrate-binding protein